MAIVMLLSKSYRPSSSVFHKIGWIASVINGAIVEINASGSKGITEHNFSVHE